MALNADEEKALSQIASALQRDAPDLCRQFRGHTAYAATTFEWLVIMTIAGGLGMAVIGVHWHLDACIALGLMLASVGPIIVGVVLSHRQR